MYILMVILFTSVKPRSICTALNGQQSLFIRDAAQRFVWKYWLQNSCFKNKAWVICRSMQYGSHALFCPSGNPLSQRKKSQRESKGESSHAAPCGLHTSYWSLSGQCCHSGQKCNFISLGEGSYNIFNTLCKENLLKRHIFGLLAH